MTFDTALIRELTQMAACPNVISEADAAKLRAEIAYYKLACKLSNGKDDKSNARWSFHAVDSKRRLEVFYRVMTGRDYFDMRRFQRLDKCDLE